MVYELLKNIFFPKLCLKCNRYGSSLCETCAKSLERADLDCPYCHKGSYFGLTHPDCKKKYGIDGIMSLYTYSNDLKKIIATIKYRLAYESCTDVLKVVYPFIYNDLELFKKIHSEWILIPVPLHKIRLKKRGFNQADIMGRYFSSKLGFNYDPDIVIRIKNTEAQAQKKSEKDRKENMKDAFSVIKDVKDTYIIVFDDVSTTGSTLFEITKELKKMELKKF